MYRHIATMLAVVVLLATPTTAVLLSGCAGSTGSSDGGTKASADVVAYIDDALPKLDATMMDWSNGKISPSECMAQVTMRRQVNAHTSADEALVKDYQDYVDNLGYFVINDGSVTLKELDQSRAKLEATLESMRP